MSEVAKSRRTIARAALALLCGFGAWQVFGGAAHAQAHKPVLHVFLQLDVKASALEKTLQEHLPDLAVTVFGRFQDFESSLREAHPDAVLGITPVLEYQGTQVGLQGLRGGKNTEPYILVSSGEPLVSSLDGKTIGVVDLMGRDGTQSFLSRLLGQGVKAKRVAKMEDLLPLLQFAAADGVVMPTAALARLKERTQLPLKARDIPNGQVGLPAVAILNSSARNLIANAFHKLDAGTNGLLGVDAWSAP
jgi:hypothetical protein